MFDFALFIKVTIRFLLVLVCLYIGAEIHSEIKEDRYSRDTFVRINRPVNKAVFACYAYCAGLLTFALLKPKFVTWQNLSLYLVVPMCLFMITGYAAQIIVRNKIEKQKDKNTNP